MIDFFILIFALAFGFAAAFSFERRLKENEERRPKGYDGFICPRCRQGFSEEELYPVWQFPAAPLRLLGLNRKIAKTNAETYEVSELDGIYCKKCRRVLNVYLVLSIVISLPIIMFLVYVAANYLGFIDG